MLVRQREQLTTSDQINLDLTYSVSGLMSNNQMCFYQDISGLGIEKIFVSFINGALRFQVKQIQKCPDINDNCTGSRECAMLAVLLY